MVVDVVAQIVKLIAVVDSVFAAFRTELYYQVCAGRGEVIRRLLDGEAVACITFVAVAPIASFAEPGAACVAVLGGG